MAEKKSAEAEKETEKKETDKAADTVEKKPAETEKEAEKKETAKTTKTAAKPTKPTKTTKRTTKKAPAKTAEKPAEETAAEKKTTRRTTKKEATAEVYIQFMGREVYTKNILSNVRRIWTDELGKKEKDLKDIKIYIKPEGNKAYYVINGDITGSVWI